MANSEKQSTPLFTGRLKWIIISVVGILLFSLFLAKSCTVVDSGEIGIKFHKWDTSEEKYGGVE
ncbi:MAG: hypothetical protein J6Y15_03315, partial [Bacteroidaceae bacterium]|nr:hypothetical protein [Bacteroidaceae bacterium]